MCKAYLFHGQLHIYLAHHQSTTGLCTTVQLRLIIDPSSVPLSSSYAVRITNLQK